MNNSNNRLEILDFASTNGGRSARPCYIPEVLDIINSSIKSSFIYKANVLHEFLETYKSYLISDNLNNLRGLENFESASYIHGTIQAFDSFYLKYSNKRLRWMEGEFAYHRIATRSYSFDGKSFHNVDELIDGDMLIISIPFSASGVSPNNIEELLSHCDLLNIPVLIDFAYISISKAIDIDLNHPCVKTIAFSLSKCYFGMERLRSGLRLTREFEDDPIDFANEFNMFKCILNKLSYRSTFTCGNYIIFRFIFL